MYIMLNSKAACIRGLLTAFLLSPLLANASDVTLAVASNFYDTSKALVKAFEDDTGYSCRISFGSTGKLFAQIRNGAPFDVFLAADTSRPRKAAEQGLAVGPPYVYAKGRLALWSAQEGLFNNGGSFLKALSYSRLAMANPKTAPYGVAAESFLSRLGLLDRLDAVLVRGDSVAQAFQFVATKNAELGLVSYAQVLGWNGPDGSTWLVPSDEYDAIEQAAVLLKRGEKNDAAAAFFSFLKGDASGRIIEAHGYGL